MSTVEQQPQASANGAGGKTIPVMNKATGDTIGHAPDLDREQIGELVARARAAQPAWDALDFDGRRRVMLDMRAWMTDNLERLLETIVAETGTTWEDAQLGTVYTLDALGFWGRKASKYLRDQTFRPHSPFLFGAKAVLRYRPYGVVGVIGPWNYPLVNNFGDAIPALMAGNAVVLKPSSVTPMTSLLIAEGWAEVDAPEDAYSVATGSGGAGSALIDFVDMVHFTGSTETGKKVMAQAAETITPVTLELGGNDPMVVCADADLERAANAALFYSMQNSGQTCISVERVYVEEPVYEQFVDKVADKARRLRLGVPDAPGAVDVGAMTMTDQCDIVERHVKDALEKGAKVVVGGERHDSNGASFFDPTVLRDVDHSMDIMREETFGPTVPIMRVRDADEAIRLANDSSYGLDSSVFTADREKGERLARRIEAGATVVNDAVSNYFATEVPIGGIKRSGLGARHGAMGIQKYCSTRNLLVTRFAPSKSPVFFPHDRRGTKVIGRAIKLLYGRGRGRLAGLRR
jgi:acyl-CoA reductase-like NAD-dependent aldehyde dehydrogenase